MTTADGTAPAGTDRRDQAEPAAAVDVPRYLRVLWHGEDSSRPGPRRGVDLHTIAAAGVRIADAEGLAAVSMRRLAAELGFTTMALYRYVASKDELLMLVTDSAYGRPRALTDSSTPWRERLAAWGNANREVIVAHPWILQLNVTEPPLTPNQVGWMEVGLESMSGTPLTEQEKLSSMLLVDVYVRGQLRLSLGMNPGGEDLPEAALLYGRRLASLIDAVAFPRISAAILSGALDDETDMSTDEFEFGLNTVLDGVATLVARHDTG